MFCELSKRALLYLSGDDCKSFLQSQLSNDINKITTNTLQINAYCQHQGKVLAIFWVMKYKKGFLLSFPLELLNKIFSRLNMFILNADVVIKDVSDKYRQIGCIDENQDENYIINNSLSLKIVEKSDKFNAYLKDDDWIICLIKNLLPEVFLATTEKFVPQMLNLDIAELGVSFSKGCYPGQEVVARLHYLGSAKRRLFIFNSSHLLNVGDLLYCDKSNSHKASGVVVSTVKYSSGFLFLATMETKYKDDIIKIKGIDKNIIKRIKE